MLTSAWFLRAAAQFYKGQELSGGTCWLKDIGGGWAKDPRSSLIWFHGSVLEGVSDLGYAFGIDKVRT